MTSRHLLALGAALALGGCFNFGLEAFCANNPQHPSCAGDGGTAGTGGGTAGTGGGTAGTGGGTAGTGGGSSDAGPGCDPDGGYGEANVVFVSATRGNDNNSGFANAPVSTLNRALAAVRLMLSQRRIVLDQGIYSSSASIELDAGFNGLIIEGGATYDGTGWRRDCSSTARTLTQLNVMSPTAFRASGPLALSLKDLELVGGEAPIAGSAYGIWAASATLTLDNVRVEAGRGGGSFQPASPGAMTGSVTCDGGPSTGAMGAVGATGPASDGGRFTSTGWVTGTGNQGSSGDPGATGTAAPAPDDTTCLGCNCQLCSNRNVSQTANPGSPGCGGLGGTAGIGGPGGGASVAVFVTGASSVRLLGPSVLQASVGGNGAPGADGGVGAPGLPGTQGAGKSCATAGQFCYGSGGGASCTGCLLGTPTTVTQPGGAAGGTGGPGGRGGHGGPGAGGWSVALALAADAGLTVELPVRMFVSDGGMGGTAGRSELIVRY